jgi:hypothetical protein
VAQINPGVGAVVSTGSSRMAAANLVTAFDEDQLTDA